jgi:hypothetical protein
MDIASNGNDMEGWQDIDISLDKPTDLAPDVPVSNGLEVTPDLLHGEFHQQAGHLGEVTQLHSQLLVTAGMLPETHIAEVQPQRQLAWVIKELHGRLNPDGLTVPLLGAEINQIHLQVLRTETRATVKLTISEENNPVFERLMPLPEEATGDLTAHFVNGRLHLRW